MTAEKSYRERIAALLSDEQQTNLPALGRAVNVLNILGDLIVECDDCGGSGFDGCDDCDMTGRRGGGKCRACRGAARIDCPTCWARGYVVNEEAW